MSTGGAKSNGTVAGGKNNVLEVRKQTSGCEASCGDQFDNGSLTGVHKCIVAMGLLCWLTCLKCGLVLNQHDSFCLCLLEIQTSGWPTIHSD